MGDLIHSTETERGLRFEHRHPRRPQIRNPRPIQPDFAKEGRSSV